MSGFVAITAVAIAANVGLALASQNWHAAIGWGLGCDVVRNRASERLEQNERKKG